MSKRKWFATICLLALAVSLAGCSQGPQVYVQSVRELVNMGGIAPGDRFAGLVVSENVAEIKKDQDKTVKELLVKSGDDVKEGDPLFSYDTDELQLNLDKQRLEKEQLQLSIENYKKQIETLEKSLNTVGGTTKLQYTIEIQSTQVDLKEAEIKLKTKEAEVAKSEELLNNATVLAPVTGRVQAVNENSTDSQGMPVPYITIQQVGSYRVKGILGEQQRGSLLEGDRITITSRTDPSQTWGGTIALVDFENPSQGNEFDRYYGMSSDEMSASSKYPFYVQLDSTEGLILGQHVYMELERPEGEPAGLSISSSFVCYEEDGSTYVWAENRGKLEKRTVTLGQMNDMTGTCQILEGLTEEDYIAFPDPELCQPGARTTHEQAVTEQTEAMPMEGGGM